MTKAAQKLVDDSLTDSAASPAGALAIWLAAQLLFLGLGSGGVALSARWPQPASSMALHVMLAGQIVVASLIFPWLLRGHRAAGLVLASAWPMLILSAIVSRRPTGSFLAAGMMATAWLMALSAWSCIVRCNRSQLISVALAALLFPGGAIAGYLRGEFIAQASNFGPLGDVMRQIDHPWSGVEAWLAPPAVFLTALIVARVHRARKLRSSQTIHPSR